MIIIWIEKINAAKGKETYFELKFKLFFPIVDK